MPSILPVYELPENPLDGSLLSAFLAADEALIRLDERARLSPLGPAWSQRVLYRNACSAMESQNCLVHLEDLVLLDGHAFSGTMYPDLSAALAILKYWQKALKGDASSLLRTPMPGEPPRPLAGEIAGDGLGARDRPDYFFEPDWDEAGRVQQWRRVWQASDALPPLLAAAIAWDAWHGLCPEQQGPWRSTLLAALVLRARVKTRQFLLPIDTGQRLCRKSWNAADTYGKRMLAFFEWVVSAAKHAAGELDGLTGARERMVLKIKQCRKNSRLPDLIELLVAKPLITIPSASKELGISKQALRILIPQLGSTPREITDRSRYRCWRVV